MKSILILTGLLYGVVLSYKMDHFITCLEQNDESPYGFKESLTWGNRESDECKEFPELCDKYADELPFAGRGDVCDHMDPITGKTRNACKMAVMYGEEIDDEKTWSWKCVELSLCPVKDETGNGTVGCLITNRRIMCCCQDDYCTADPLYAEYAQYGRPDFYPPDFDAILAIDSGDVTVMVNIPGYEGSVESVESDEESSEDGNVESSSSAAEEISSSSSEESEEAPEVEKEEEYSTQYMYAKSPFKAHRYDQANAMEASPVIFNSSFKNVVMLMLTYLVIGVICLGIGVFIGVTLNNNAATQKRKAVHNDYL